MSMSLMFLIFSSSSTKVSISNWVGWLRRVQHAEGRKKRKKQKQELFCYGRAERKKERNKQGHSAKEILVEAKSK